MLDNFYQKSIIDQINSAAGATTSFIIKDLIKRNSGDVQRMKKLWEEYKGNTDIFTMQFPQTGARPDNRVNADFRGEIIRQVAGYGWGIPIKYNLNPDKYTSDAEFNKVDTIVQNFLKRNDYDDLNYETEVYTAVCGKGYNLIYYQDIKNDDGTSEVDLRIINIKPWESIVITDPTTEEVQLAMIYYQVEIQENNTKSKFRYRVEFYDRQYVHYYMEDGQGNFYEDDTYGETKQEHGFDYVPLIKFQNNSQESGDFESVSSLIDAYSKTTSFSLNDLESFANSYLLFLGVEPTADTIALAKSTGAFFVPKNDQEDANNDIRFLTKDGNIQDVTQTLEQLSKDIYRFAASIDLSDEKFSGNSSGVAISWKLMNLENKTKTKERKYSRALREIFKVSSTFWSRVKGIKVLYNSMTFIYTRNVPITVNISELIGLKQSGILTTETALQQLTWVNEPQKEAEKAKLEMGEPTEKVDDGG